MFVLPRVANNLAGHNDVNCTIRGPSNEHWTYQIRSGEKYHVHRRRSGPINPCVEEKRVTNSADSSQTIGITGSRSTGYVPDGGDKGRWRIL